MRSETNRRNAAPLAIGAALVACAFALYAAHILFDLGGGETSELFDQWLYLAILAAAGALCVARAVKLQDARAGWALVGLALLSFAAGDLYWTEVLADRAGEITFPSLADIGYLAYFPLAFAGIVLIVRDRLRNRPAGLWLDAAAVALAIASIGSAAVIETVSAGLGDGVGAFVEGLIYPITDLLLLAFLGAILVVCGERFR